MAVEAEVAHVHEVRVAAQSELFELEVQRVGSCPAALDQQLQRDLAAEHEVLAAKDLAFGPSAQRPEDLVATANPLGQSVSIVP